MEPSKSDLNRQLENNPRHTVELYPSIPPTPYTKNLIDHYRPSRDDLMPLLRLPQGLKDKVYEYVCGGSFVHINGVGKNPNSIPSKSTSNFCYAPISEQDARGDEKVHPWYTLNLGY